ncbi:hypothetical protein M2139_001359 [Enterococcus sp. PF1-24]|uniref:hypothetical protein n=1 Tax=unclassified Enterococcus TaxID=2608891 RepID=UPI00247439EA|nr:MULTISPECIES: hypothetical protein [unclassified Enterococcus]MDH6364336.1 hypothetical protein [Enterococcus sp. PFB1-1]MDH6401475.1 hypothetical protein [Enterococcus sp. PF1-24]
MNEEIQSLIKTYKKCYQPKIISYCENSEELFYLVKKETNYNQEELLISGIQVTDFPLFMIVRQDDVLMTASKREISDFIKLKK